jgi:GNAT superfamily N-acetyltransferase
VALTIRKAKPSDLAAVQSAVSVLRIPEMPYCDWYRLREIRPVIAAGRYFIAEVDGKVAGVVSIGMHRRRHEVEIEILAIKKSFQGQGLGRRLVSFAEAFGKRRGATRSTVGSFFVYGAKKFYLGLGYKVSDTWRYRDRRSYTFSRRLT